MKLYHSPLTSSFRCRWTLEELGVPYELAVIDLAKGEHKTPEHLRLHPLGSVPVLVLDDGETIIESAAICMYLAELNPKSAMAPPVGAPQRAAYLQWVMYAMTTVYPVVHGVYLRCLSKPAEARRETATDGERAALARVLDLPMNALATRPFLVGDALSTADILLGGLLLWADTTGQLSGADKATAYLDRLRERPAFQRALAD